MARASVFPDGRFENRTVQQVINMGDMNYLLFQYYMYSRISFLPDILEEIGITGKRVIEKPGKVTREQFHKFAKEIHIEINAKTSLLDWQKKHSHQTKRARKRSKRVMDSMEHSKSWLANKNRTKL